MHIRVLGIVLAGGKGTRLYPLTRERAKPAVPFGGKYRIIDFVLSNFINSGIYSVYVLTQFRSQSLLQHLSEGWQFGSLLKTQFVIPVPAQMRSPGETWYQGTADAIYQNINLVEQSDPHVVAIFGGDHIYRMNITEHDRVSRAEERRSHRRRHSRAAETGRRIRRDRDRRGRPHPGLPREEPRRAHHARRSGAGLRLHGQLRLLHPHPAAPAARRRRRRTSNHDFGRDILPSLAGRRRNLRLRFPDQPHLPGEPTDAEPYWRDVGTIDAYYEANMDLRSVSPALNLYNREWPVRTTSYPDPPAKFTFDEENRRGQAIDCIVSGGCILSGGMVRNSVLGRGVRVHSGAVVEDCVILDNCDIGRRARVRRAILDKNVRVPDDAAIGYDLERDRAHHHVTESGIVVVGGNRTPVDITSLVV